ncbi:purine-cytosine permease family protein [Amycolatopsis taiwanensis]|uniref:purine-cytosine permease family protein n=1 Tax=Amycolatopsis taiwanensis TaxID=342230 RepID=UPI0004B4823F|nr:cytosine permease [Amycolatopsis taiwanensis]
MAAPTVEVRTIDQIPENERHGRARDLFTIWFGSNIMVLTVVTGALSTTVYGLPLGWALLGILIGNLVGGIFMALHSAQGPQLGVPQMVQTRGQFGVYGSLLVVVLVIIMYAGYFASNLVLGGQSLHIVAPGVSVPLGIVIVGVVSVVATIFGYKLIHTYSKIMTVTAGLALLLAFCWILFVHGVPTDLFGRGTVSATGMLGTISAAALWQIAYAPYVSDYSRYMPKGTGSKPSFWATYGGCVLGSVLPMILGALTGAIVGGDDPVGGLAQLTPGISTVILIVLSLGVANTNAMNLYCGVLCVITVGQTLRRSWVPRAGGRAVVAVAVFAVALLLALAGKDNFLVVYQNFIALLLYVLTPWTAINLVDYYLVRHGEYDVMSFFRADGGVYGRFNGPAIIAYVVGIVVQVPFFSSDLYTGPVADLLGGVDVSWIVGLLITCPFYYLAAKRWSSRTQPLDPAAVPADATSNP